MIAQTIRCGFVAAVLSTGAAHAAFLDDSVNGVMDGVEKGTEAGEGEGQFDAIVEELVVEKFDDEIGFTITCWDCEGTGEGDFVITETPGDDLAPVPLPAGGVLLLGGLAALGWTRRRR